MTPLGSKLPQCCLPLLALRSLKTLRALSLGKNKRAVLCAWRSRIADRNNAPRSVSRVHFGFRDDYMGGVCSEKLPQCCLPHRPKVLKNLKGVKLGWAKTCGNDHEIADSCLRNTPRWGLGCDLLYCKGNPPPKIMLKNTIGI